MAYCTQADLLEQIEETDLIGLTDDENTGEIIDAIVTRAIVDADGEIDSYCGGSYDVPFAPAPVMIRKISVDIAIYNLYTRRAIRVVQEERKQRYDNAVRFLKDVSRGLVKLGADAPAQANPVNQATIAGNSRIFTRDKMRGF